MNTPTIAADTLSDPSWLAHRYDAGHDAIHFLRADRPARAAATFLTDAELPDTPKRIISRADVPGACPESAPLHYIFHSAYCCSTLLARAFDYAGASSSLKEPQILNDIVGWRHRGGNPKRIGPVLDAALRCLGRPFQSGEAVVIKPSNVVNGLAAPMLAIRPNARAILLHAPLPAFLASIARKGMWGRLWVRELLSKQLLDGLVDLGFDARDYLLLTDLQAAAVGWIAQHALFARIAGQSNGRAVLLDSEDLVREPAALVAAAARHFTLLIGDSDVDAIVAREFGRDAKTGEAFAAGQRESQRAAGETVHADELAKVATWAEAVAGNAGVAIQPDRDLYLG